MEFREHHLQQILGQWLLTDQPLDGFMNRYFREHTALGSKDRRFIGDEVYSRVRWKSLFEFLKRPTPFNPQKHITDSSIPLHIRLSCPLPLYEILEKERGQELAELLALGFNERAPLTIRANLLKISRDDLFEKLKTQFNITKTANSPSGIVFHERVNFAIVPEFKEGLFEIQDEASQLVASQVKASPKDHVLDFCAGAGGKALGFAHLLQGKGQIFLHDIRTSALNEARKRLNRAGIQNAQFNLPRQTSMDWIIVDVPCSGSGTYRRNPDLKWKFTEKTLPRLIQEQRDIFDEALSYLKPGGHIIYSTCSLLKDENESQVEFFQTNYNLRLVTTFQSLPKSGEMDGFFAATLVK